MKRIIYFFRSNSAFSVLVKLFFVVFLISAFLMNYSCKTTSDLKCPYEISGEMEIFNEKVSGNAFKFSFENKSEKIVKNFVVVFSFYDSDGEPCFYDRDFLEFRICREIFPYNAEEFVIPLDSFIESQSETEFFVDYVYAKEIVYEDEVFEDPFGRFLYE